MKIDIRYIAEMPDTIRGVCSKRGEESYLILINDSIADIVKRHTLGHELAHIGLGHHECKKTSISIMEKQANKHAWEYYRMYRDNGCVM